MFEDRFAKMPDEPVEMISPTSTASAKSAGISGISANSSSDFYESDLAEERPARRAELQEQVGVCIDLTQK